MPADAASELDQDSSTQMWSFSMLSNDGQEPNGQDGQGQVYPEQGQQQGQPGQIQPGQTYPGQGGLGQNGPQQQPQYDQNGQCINCGNTVEYRPGTQQSVYPVQRRTIYQQNQVDVYPQQQVDVYPVERVRIHPTQTTYNQHPLQRQIEYVGGGVQSVNQCVPGSNFCSLAFGQQSPAQMPQQYVPTVNYAGYQQFYHYQASYVHGGYRYYRFCRPTLWQRLARWFY
jgi:hypothetical protein